MGHVQISILERATGGMIRIMMEILVISVYKHAFTEDEIQTAMNELEDSMENPDNQFRGFG
jgi:hypothetical protein